MTPPGQRQRFLSRARILAFRRELGSLDQRLPSGADSLRQAAWAGLQDSVPRAALLSLHARVGGITSAAWEDPSLVQLWGPRFTVYVVAARDLSVFSVGRLATGGARRRRAEEVAARLAEHLAGRSQPYGEAGRALGVDPNQLRYAAPTGTVLLRWDGARPPVVWTVPAPAVDEDHARQELARRFLRVLGPSTAEAYATWAGIPAGAAAATFHALGASLTPVRTPVGDAWILAEDEEVLDRSPEPPAPARLLPSGDAFFLLWGADRELLVEDPDHRRQLWPSRVWPGAVLVDGEVVGTWRRAEHTVRIRAWRRLSGPQRTAVESEASRLPLPGLQREIVVRWEA